MRVQDATYDELALSWLRRYHRDIEAGTDYRAFSAWNNAGHFQGLVAFTNFLGQPEGKASSAQVHVALGTPFAALPLWRAFTKYAFETCGLSSVMALVPGQSRINSIARKLGFRFVGLVAAGFGDRDLVILQLRPEYIALRRRKAA